MHLQESAPSAFRILCWHAAAAIQAVVRGKFTQPSETPTPTPDTAVADGSHAGLHAARHAQVGTLGASGGAPADGVEVGHNQPTEGDTTLIQYMQRAPQHNSASGGPAGTPSKPAPATAMHADTGTERSSGANQMGNTHAASDTLGLASVRQGADDGGDVATGVSVGHGMQWPLPALPSQEDLRLSDIQTCIHGATILIYNCAVQSHSCT